MKVTLLGTGCGPVPDIWADYVIGAARLIENCTGAKAAATKAEEILNLLLASGGSNCTVLYSGDTGFYSGVRTLLPLLKERGIETEVLPGLSSAQMLAARLGRPWQDWSLYSAHGTNCDAVAAVCEGKAAFFLTGGPSGPSELCSQLTEAGLGNLPVAVGENLGFDGEKVTQMTAAECFQGAFASLNVLLTEATPRYPRRVPGIPDTEFLRQEGVPMTKQEIRTAILAKLAIGPADICWDIGAGTGSVSVELALQCRAVWGVEQKPNALALAQANRKKFGAWNLRLVEGTAPEALAALPRPDAVFIGGSGGELPEILAAVRRANSDTCVCVSAVTLETLHLAMEALRDPEVTQIAVNQTWRAGEVHMLLARNPVFLVTGTLK